MPEYVVTVLTVAGRVAVTAPRSLDRTEQIFARVSRSCVPAIRESRKRDPKFDSIEIDADLRHMWRIETSDRE